MLTEARAVELCLAGMPYVSVADYVALIRAVERELRRVPVPLLLYCPCCQQQHIDAPNPGRGWENPPHRSHECQNCGLIWRPSDQFTVGVAVLETRGGKDESAAPLDYPDGIESVR